MPDRNVFLPLPAELYAEALAVARKRRITVSDLLIEALVDSLETKQHRAWTAERLPQAFDRLLLPH